MISVLTVFLELVMMDLGLTPPRHALVNLVHAVTILAALARWMLVLFLLEPTLLVSLVCVLWLKSFLFDELACQEIWEPSRAWTTAMTFTLLPPTICVVAPVSWSMAVPALPTHPKDALLSRARAPVISSRVVPLSRLSTKHAMLALLLVNMRNRIDHLLLTSISTLQIMY